MEILEVMGDLIGLSEIDVKKKAIEIKQSQSGSS
jgi:hypothetical protein